jgi:hypothetical protein
VVNGSIEQLEVGMAYGKADLGNFSDFFHDAIVISAP